MRFHWFLRSLARNWEQIPQDKHVSLTAACIPGRKRDSRARLMLLSAHWCALCIIGT